MIKTGSIDLDIFIEGYKEELNLIYGPPGSGKTTLCKLAAIELLKQNKKVIYIDTENGFSIERFKQLTNGSFAKLFDNLIIIKVKNLNDQFEKVENIKKLNNISLVIIDSIGKFYRSTVKENHKEINEQFVSHLNSLRGISKNNTPVIITNQVYSDIINNKNIPLGGKIIKNFCKKIIELNMKPRKLALRKPEEKEILFEIIKEGIKIINP